MPTTRSKKRTLSGKTDSTSDDDSRTSSFTKSPKRSRSNSAKAMTDPEVMEDLSSDSDDENIGGDAPAAESTIARDEHAFSDLSSSSSENEGGDDKKDDSGPELSNQQSASSSGKKSPTRKKKKKKKKPKQKKRIKRVENVGRESPESDQDFSDLDMSSDGDDGAELIINLNDDVSEAPRINKPVIAQPPVPATDPAMQPVKHTESASITPHGAEVRQTKKASGAISVSVGLKLGGARGVGRGLKIGRPTSGPVLFGKAPTREVEVVDYTTSEKLTTPISASAGADAHITQAPTNESSNDLPGKLNDSGTMVIDDDNEDGAVGSGNDSEGSAPLSMGSGDFTALADAAVSGRSSGREDNMDDDSGSDDSAASDSDSSMDSVDSLRWRRQRQYYYRQVTPELLAGDSTALFRANESIEEAKARLAAEVPGLTKLVEKHHICDVCTGKHRTETCEHLKCKKCGAYDEHFTHNCPTIAEKDRTCHICMELNGVSVSHEQGEPCSHIWRSLPTSGDDDLKKLKKIPVFCYSCGQEGHFGDNCPINRHRVPAGSGLSIWNRDSAKQWTTMKFPGDITINPFKNFGAAKDSPIQLDSSEGDGEDGEIDEDDEEEEDGWFASRKKAVKEKIPDSKYTGMKTELPIAPKRGGYHPNDSFRGAGRGLSNRPNHRPPSPDRYGEQSRRRSRSPPYRGRGGGGGGFGRGGSYRSREPDQHQREPIRFGMGRGGHQPPLPPGPLPPGPAPNMRSSRDYYRSASGGKQAWQQFRR